MKKSLFILLLLSNLWSFGQNFDTLSQNISNELETVQSGKKEYQQSLDVQAPGVVMIQMDIVDSKGKTKTEQYLFNLADIDPNTVRASAKRDVIVVNLSTEKKQKLINKTVNEEKSSYISNFIIYASDMDNGRRLAKAIKAAIPTSKKILEKRLSLNSYNDRLKWLQNHIKNVDLVKKQIGQEWTPADTYPGAINFQKNIASGKSEKDIIYSFNLANLNPKHIDFYISGNMFSLKLETAHGDKLIKVIEKDVQKPYTNKMTLACSNVEEARDIQKVLTDIIPLARKKLEAAMPKVTSLSKGIEEINKLIANVNTGDEEYSQDFNGDCVVKFTQNVNAKKSYEDVYDFNLIDINPNQVKPKTKSKIMLVSLKTKNGNKFIKQTHDGEVKGYKTGIEILVPGAEEANIVSEILKKMIKICQKKDKDNQNKTISKTQAFTQLKNNLKTFDLGDTNYNQEVELTENNKNIKYTLVIAGSKSAKELLYEVNLSDLNPKSLKIKVSGKKLTVEIKSNHLEKLIKYYKDGKIQSYQNKIIFYAPDVETARQIKQSFKSLLKK